MLTQKSNKLEFAEKRNALKTTRYLQMYNRDRYSHGRPPGGKGGQGGVLGPPAFTMGVII